MGFFKRAPAPPPPKTVIGPKTTLKGALSSRQDVEVLGAVEGPVRCKATIFVMAEGQVQGEMACVTLSCEGSASGKAEVSGLSAFGETATWDGDLSTARLAVSKGARLTGTIKALTTKP